MEFNASFKKFFESTERLEKERELKKRADKAVRAQEHVQTFEAPIDWITEAKRISQKELIRQDYIRAVAAEENVDNARDRFEEDFEQADWIEHLQEKQDVFDKGEAISMMSEEAGLWPASAISGVSAARIIGGTGGSVSGYGTSGQVEKHYDYAVDPYGNGKENEVINENLIADLMEIQNLRENGDK